MSSEIRFILAAAAAIPFPPAMSVEAEKIDEERGKHILGMLGGDGVRDGHPLAQTVRNLRHPL